MADHTTPDASTKQEDRKDATATADPGPMPSAAEEQAAEQNEPAKASVAAANDESREIGANVKGEGQLP